MKNIMYYPNVFKDCSNCTERNNCPGNPNEHGLTLVSNKCPFFKPIKKNEVPDKVR